VLVGTHVPGALVEMMFINNPNDERLLSQSGVRQNLAEGLNQGIKDFLIRKERSKE
jgi:N-acetylmuramoyl-L-alanine amidase